MNCRASGPGNELKIKQKDMADCKKQPAMSLFSLQKEERCRSAHAVGGGGMPPVLTGEGGSRGLGSGRLSLPPRFDKPVDQKEYQLFTQKDQSPGAFQKQQ